MPVIDPSECSINQCAFLDMLAVSEIGAKLLAASDNGYNVIVGGSLFHDYSDHPRILVEIRAGLKSTAAGRYQLLSKYFDPYALQLGLHDFSPLSQDKIALQQIKERRAIPLIEAGNFNAAVDCCKNIWASLPNAGYGQHQNDIASLRKAYQQAGGLIV